MKQIAFFLIFALFGCNKAKNDNQNSNRINVAGTIIRFQEDKTQDISINFIAIPDFIEFEGTIDSKQKIHLSLFFEGSFAFGKYSYIDTYESFTLKGYVGIGDGYVEINVIEYEPSDKWPAIYNNTPKAIWSGYIKNGIFSGDWTNLKSNIKLPFVLNKLNLKNNLAYTKFCIETKINDKVFINDFTTDTYYQCKPSIDYKWNLIKGDDYYILLSASHFSKCAAYDRGNCGSGIERFLIFQHLNIKTNLQMQQIIQFESCENFHKNLTLAIDDNLSNAYSDNNDNNMKEFNLKNFSSLKLIADSSEYTLQSCNLNSGFVLKKRENENLKKN